MHSKKTSRSNSNETSRGFDVEDMKRDFVSSESAMFCTHLSHFGYAVQLLPERGFSYRACDEEMPKPQLVLTLLKIIRILLTITKIAVAIRFVQQYAQLIAHSHSF